MEHTIDFNANDGSLVTTWKLAQVPGDAIEVLTELSSDMLNNVARCVARGETADKDIMGENYADEYQRVAQSRRHRRACARVLQLALAVLPLGC